MARRLLYIYVIWVMQEAGIFIVVVLVVAVAGGAFK